MGKIKNQSGFSAVEALLFLVIIAIIGGAGWYVYNAQKKTNSTYNAAAKVSNSPVASPYAGWKTYSDSDFSFKYSPTWTTVAPGGQGEIASNVSLMGPKADHAYYTLTGEKSKPQIDFNFFNNLADPSSCQLADSACKVELVTPLKIKGLSDPKLITVELTEPSDPSFGVTTFQVVDSSTVKVDDTNPPDHFSVSSRDYQLEGCSPYGSGTAVAGDLVCADIGDVQAFQQSADFKNLVTSLNSVVFQ